MGLTKRKKSYFLLNSQMKKYYCSNQKITSLRSYWPAVGEVKKSDSFCWNGLFSYLGSGSSACDRFPAWGRCSWGGGRPVSGGPPSPRAGCNPAATFWACPLLSWRRLPPESRQPSPRRTPSAGQTISCPRSLWRCWSVEKEKIR